MSKYIVTILVKSSMTIIVDATHKEQAYEEAFKKAEYTFLCKNCSENMELEQLMYDPDNEKMIKELH